MAAPMIGMLGMGSSLMGGLTGALGSIMGGSSQSAMYKYQAGIATMNAKVAKQNAEYAIQSGESQSFQSGQKTRFQIGQQKTAQGASNLDVNSGSPSQVRDSQQAVGMVDQSTIRTNAGRKAYGFEVESAQDTAQAGADLAAAKNATTAGDIGAFSSIIGSAGSVSSKWLQGNQIGLWNG
jgi:hypothetical protein